MSDKSQKCFFLGQIEWATYNMEQHVTNGQKKSPEAKRKRTRGWELCLVLWSCDLTQKMHGWISRVLAALKFRAHLLVFLHSKLRPNKVASNKKGMGEELQNVWRSGKSWFFLQENFIWLILVIFNLSYLVRGKTSWLQSLSLSIIYIPWQAYISIPKRLSLNEQWSSEVRKYFPTLQSQHNWPINLRQRTHWGIVQETSYSCPLYLRWERFRWIRWEMWSIPVSCQQIGEVDGKCETNWERSATTKLQNKVSCTLHLDIQSQVMFG